jgi:DNA modification methylase
MGPYFADSSVTLWHGDSLEVLHELPGASVDAVVTDPPYGISFMGKQWDQPGKFGSKSRRGGGPNKKRGDQDAALEAGRYDPSPHAMHNFQAWCQAWAAECLRVLKPGGHLLAFGGSRTWHRLQCGIEDAGFEIRDSIAWLYGSGFPKSLDVSKAIDKSTGENRARQLECTAWMRTTGLTAAQINAATSSFMGSHYLTDGAQAAIPTAGMFDLLRPLLPEVPERIERLVAERTGIEWTDYVNRPVLRERFRAATGRAEQGSGGYAFAEDFADTSAATEASARWQGWGTALKPAFEPIVVARKPLDGTVAANVLAHGTGALNIDACRIDTNGEQLHTSTVPSDMRGGHYGSGHRPGESSAQRRYTDHGATDLAATPGPRGGDSRGRWPANVILDEHQAAALDAQSGVLSSGVMRAGTRPKGDRDTYGRDAAEGYETRHDTPGDSGGASRFFLRHARDDGDWEIAERFYYLAKADSSERVRVNGVAHPTVKPLELMRWLVRLVTPPGGKVLEPFAGSGTTVEACLLEGMRCVAIEREGDYLPLIRQRIDRRRNPVAAIVRAGDDTGLFGLLDEGGVA